MENGFMNKILDRINDISSFPVDDLCHLGAEDVVLCYGKSNFFLEKGSIIKKTDISFLSENEIQELLYSFPFLNEKVSMVWAYEKCGVRLPYEVFCDFFDRLWYPSSDDIWIFDSVYKHYLEISHEEIIILYH
ncbi:hypothetical protein FACS1894170_07140 [Planctomycetales bacterium]|nr:hypothetical protein FACS1894170_07140 [Planctomycetales bacterium]